MNTNIKLLSSKPTCNFTPPRLVFFFRKYWWNLFLSLNTLSIIYVITFSTYHTLTLKNVKCLTILLILIPSLTNPWLIPVIDSKSDKTLSTHFLSISGIESTNLTIFCTTLIHLWTFTIFHQYLFLTERTNPLFICFHA